MTFGMRLKKIREERKMKQVTLAERLGVTQKDISRWENGERTPNANSLRQICMELRVSADELLEINYNDIRYIVVEDGMGNYDMTVFGTLGEANEDASYKWSNLTKKEKEKYEIFVTEVNKKDLEDEDCWTSFWCSNNPEGGFDSNKLTENDE